MCIRDSGLIGQGGVLVADDQVDLTRDGAEIIAAPPAAIAGLIEVRGIGILRVEFAPAPVRLVVDLGRTETERLPPIRHTALMDMSRPLVLGPPSAHLPVAICLLLQGGRVDPEADLQPETR